MKINEIIRTKRIEKGITQQQAASYLGVTASAVNKWEREISYPDITLLPAIARMLDTDLNTLLSFKEELTISEIHNFLDKIATVATEQGIEEAFRLSMDKIHEYPSCDTLILNTALTLEGLIDFSFIDTANTQAVNNYLNAIEELYLRAAEGKNLSVTNQAKSMLFYKYIRRKEYNKAMKMLNELPDKNIFPNKEILQASLYTAQKNFSQACQILERNLLLGINDILSYLSNLIDIALKEERIDDASILANKAKQAATIFDLNEYTANISFFQIAVVQKDADKCFSVLKKMLPALEKEWAPSHSPLYKHIPKKETSGNMKEIILNKLISEFENPNSDEYSFMRESPKLKELLDSI